MKEEIQKKYVELQLVNQQIKQVQEQFILMQKQLNELASLESNLNDIKGIKKDSEMFSSLGAGVFVSNKLSSNENVLVNVGNGILIEKKADEAIDLVRVQVNNLKEAIENVRGQLIKASEYNEQLTNEINELIKKEESSKK